MKDFLELAKARYSVRGFDGRDIPEEDINKIIEAGIAAPTAVNYQPIKIWAFRSEEARAKLISCTGMKFIEPAKVIFAVGADPAQAWTRPSDKKSFADVDAAIVITHMLLEIHDLGYGSTWIGHFDVNALGELFPETKAYNMIGLIPVSGIAMEPSERHPRRKPRSEIVTEL
ncbi:MAG: nitroreductase family protein [Ruminiclostridium sp.]|nr:nitroreductase family protein [Ruminiclostridium sp.]